MSGFERGDDRATMFKRHEDTSKVVQGGLMAVSALLSLGSNLPLVGQLCEAAKGCLDSAEEFKSKAKDVTIAARRVCDVLDIVYLMAQNVDRLEEKALVESKMRRLVDLLVKFNAAVRKFGKKGWMKRAWTMRGHVESLTSLDKEIVSQLDVFRDAYRFARDKDMIQRTYNIEASMNQLVEARVRETREPEGTVVAVLSNDPVAIASVAVDADLPAAELASELSEVRESLDGLNKKMQKMLDCKQGDRAKIAKVLAFVKAAVARDEKLLAAVQDGSSKLEDLKVAARRDGAKLDDLQAAARRDGAKLDDLDAAVREVAAGLGRKTKVEQRREHKNAQMARREIKLGAIEAEPFAKGGNSKLHKAEYHGETVVLKKIDQAGITAAKRQKMLESFKRELAIMVLLMSPRIVRVLGVVTTDVTFLGLVMEYCAGGALRHRLDDEGAVITSHQRRTWVSDVAVGMEYLHSQGVEHRDLKALNVLLTDDDRCKVSDFGLSKCEELRTAATSTMGQAGTPAFMAPEFLDENVFSEASDVYSFAIVMWEIWSRQVPWSGLRPMQIMKKVDKGERPPIPAGMPAELRELMVRAWAHNTGERPTFEQLAAKLKVSKVVDLSKLALVRTLEGHSDHVECVAMFPDGRRVVSASDDRTLKVWDVATGKCVATLKGHSRAVYGVAVLPDGRRVVSASYDKTLKVWDIATGKCVATLKGHTETVRSVAVFPDGRRVVSASWDNTLKVWDVATGECVATLEGHSGDVSSVAVFPDGRRVVSGSWDNTLKVWDVATGECVATLKGHTETVYGVAVLPDGRRVVSASYDKTLKVWDIATGKCVATLKGHSESVWGVAISPDGRRVVSGSMDKTLKVWDVATGECVATLEGHSYDVNCVAISPDGRRVVSASGDNTLKLFAC